MKLQSFILSVMLIGSISINAFCQNNSTNELGEAINRPIELSPSMFSSNLPGKDGEGFDKLLDDDINTFYHSTWDVPSEQKELIFNTEPYIDIQLIKSVYCISFSYTTRNTDGWAPLKFTLSVSVDGNRWKQIRVFDVETDALPIGAAETYRSDCIKLGGNYKYIRFQLNESSKRKYFVLSEFRLWEVIYDITNHYISNFGFDEDLTFQADGSMKEIVNTSTSLSDRSWAYIAEDQTVYAKPKTTSSQSRPDGRKLDAVNGFIGQVNGWENVNNQTFPKCEWVYYGTIPYDLESQTIPIADNGTTYLEVPSRPAIASGEDNVGFAYFRAGWGGRAVYKQTVNLPKAKYSLEYWTINLNPNATNGKNLAKVTCGENEYVDDSGINDIQWTKHTITFDAEGETSIELGYESSGGSGSNPFLCLDVVQLFKIGHFDNNSVVQFVDEEGYSIDDGSTITITEGEDDGWGGTMFPSGLYVQNTSDEDIYVGIDYDIKELPNGSFQICFPQNCIIKTKTGTGKTPEGLLQAGVKKSLMAEWLPNENGFGTCTVDFKVNTYTYNSSTKQYELQTEGSTVTVRMVYSDPGNTPQPSTNSILLASSPTILKGKLSTLSLNLKNKDEVIAFEFDLQLPDCITITKDEDNDLIATLSSRCSDHSLAVSDQGNGLYHFLCYSNSNKVISGNEGELLTIELLCDGSVAVGTYQATIKNIIFSDVDKNKITPADITFDLEVIEAVPGDVNKDGEINVMDVVEMVAYIMGQGSEGFVFAAADLYPDGAINVMDLVNLVELIMNSSASNAREWTENSMSLSTLADGAVSVKVNNPEQYVASEFIVEVSSGQTLETVTADKHHRVTCSQLDDSHYKVMAYSSANSTFNSDALVQLHISGEGMVNVHDALLVDESRKGVAFAPAVGGYTTGINQMENGKLIIENSSVYDLQGKKRDTSRPYRHEVLIVNGKKQVVR